MPAADTWAPRIASRSGALLEKPQPVQVPDATPTVINVMPSEAKLIQALKQTPKGWRATPVRDQSTGLILYIDLLPL